MGAWENAVRSSELGVFYASSDAISY